MVVLLGVFSSYEVRFLMALVQRCNGASYFLNDVTVSSQGVADIVISFSNKGS